MPDLIQFDQADSPEPPAQFLRLSGKFIFPAAFSFCWHNQEIEGRRQMNLERMEGWKRTVMCKYGSSSERLIKVKV
jgi:hypothetical protein